MPDTFAKFIGYLDERKIEPLLTQRLRNAVRPVEFGRGRATIALEPGTDRELASALRLLLRRLYGGEWAVSVVESSDAATVAEMTAASEESERAEVLEHPLVQATLEAFPGATVRAIRSREIAVEPHPVPDDEIIPPLDED